MQQSLQSFVFREAEKIILEEHCIEMGSLFSGFNPVADQCGDGNSETSSI